LTGNQLVTTLTVLRHSETAEEAIEWRAGRHRNLFLAWTGGGSLNSYPDGDNCWLHFGHDVGEPDRMLRQLLRLLRQILCMRRAGEKGGARTRVRRNEQRGGAKSRDRGRH
jgi:hypothetical protein